ncbi:MAG TPA: hypothetical protein VFM14_12530 [Gemmatimonadales bacterium]|nr:hypothetical protein [Gemmatimonadales bacterium]
MLTAAEALRVERRRRPRRSLRQQYDEYSFERIEAYKNSLPREELMRLGDEANAETFDGSEGQFVLTEVLMVDLVDELIKRRLKLKSFRQWAKHIRALRDAQREPTHWGLEPDSPVAGLLRRIETGDRAVVVGAAGEAAACLLAAHDMGVTFMACDLGSVTRIETRFESEAMASAFEAYVVDFALWLPPLEDGSAIAVLDVSALGELDPSVRESLVRHIQCRTCPNGVHVLIPGATRFAPDALLGLYDGWVREEVGRPHRRGARTRGIALTRQRAGTEAPSSVVRASSS